MGFYDRHLLPHVLNCLCGMGIITEQRAKLVPLAEGRVLEIGIGTGLNLPFYDASRVTHICGVDPATEMHAMAKRQAAKISIPVETIALELEQIAAPSASFDTVVSTFTLCSIPDAVGALKEMRRVLKPGGRLLFCEHGLAPETSVQAWQQRLTPFWKPLAGGCHLNRDIPQLLAEGGFTITSMEKQYIKAPKIMAYIYRGAATA